MTDRCAQIRPPSRLSRFHRYESPSIASTCGILFRRDATRKGFPCEGIRIIRSIDRTSVIDTRSRSMKDGSCDECYDEKGINSSLLDREFTTDGCSNKLE